MAEIEAIIAAAEKLTTILPEILTLVHDLQAKVAELEGKTTVDPATVTPARQNLESAVQQLASLLPTPPAE